MWSLHLILLFACCMCDADSAPKPTRPLKFWWDYVQDNDTAKKIGVGVQVTAWILYDDAYKDVNKVPMNVGAAKPSANDKSATEHFNNLFKKVQHYFNNRSIMINITVFSVEENNNLSVHFEKGVSLDGYHTLENLTKYGDSKHAPNNTIFFLYTWGEKEGSKKFRGFVDFHNRHGPSRPGASEVATKGTFCTTNTSAAVIRHLAKNTNYWSTVKSMADIFGSPHFIAFTDKDREKMADRFSHCGKHTEEQDNISGSDILHC
uniref:28 kDa Metastriate family member n=1 Tax=Rhipicephalus zambeziensis TaxID=60191 RepID=A0A224YAA4_9ACAR